MEDKRNQQLSHKNSALRVQFTNNVCTALYALLSATQHLHFRRLFIITNSHHSLFGIIKNTKYHQIDSFKLHIETGGV